MRLSDELSYNVSAVNDDDGTVSTFPELTVTDNNPVGDPLGSFLVTYNDTRLVLSDFQPAPNAAEHKRVRASSSRPTLDGKE